MLEILRGPHGFAFRMRLPDLFSKTFNYEYLTQDDREFLKEYLSLASPDPKHYASVFYSFLQNADTMIAFKNSLNDLIPILEDDQTLMGAAEFLNTIAPELFELVIACDATYDDRAGPGTLEFLTKLQAKLKAIQAKMGCIQEVYAKIYEDYKTLTGTYPDENYTTPNQFASHSWGIKTIDLLEPATRSPSADNSSKEKKKKSKHKKKQSKPLTQQAKQPIAQSASPSLAPTTASAPSVSHNDSKADFKESKESKDNARNNSSSVARERTPPVPSVEANKPASKPSLFANRQFPKTFFYDQRVSQKRGDPFHDFTRYVDNFLGTAYCEIDQWKPGHTRYLLPAEFILPDGQKFSGVIQYTLDEKGVCYHRYFDWKKEEELLERAYDTNFPALDTSYKQYLEKKAATEAILSDEIPNGIMEVIELGKVRIRDPENKGLVIILHKVGRRKS